MNIFFQAQELIAMFINMGDGQGVWKVVDETPETFEEAVMLALVIASFYAHPHVHYWSNGVAQLMNTIIELGYAIGPLVNMGMSIETGNGKC